MGGPAESARGRRAARPSPRTHHETDHEDRGGVVRRALADYLSESQRPIVVLVFLLPAIAFYEIRLAMLALGGEPLLVNKAQHGVLRFLEAIGLGQAGVLGMALPGLVLVVLLLIWQGLAGGPWRTRPPVLLGMFAESVLMALPLLAISRFAAAPPLAAVGPWSDLGISGALAISLGAGLYEELVFRLLLLAVLHTVLVDMLRIGEAIGAITSIVIAAIAFTLYHPLAADDGSVEVFRVAFYLVAGVWLGILMLKRGFGIAVGAHATYDIATLLVA
jgi:hypothetical protein